MAQDVLAKHPGWRIVRLAGYGDSSWEAGNHQNVEMVIESPGPEVFYALISDYKPGGTSAWQGCSVMMADFGQDERDAFVAAFAAKHPSQQLVASFLNDNVVSPTGGSTEVFCRPLATWNRRRGFRNEALPKHELWHMTRSAGDVVWTQMHAD